MAKQDYPCFVDEVGRFTNKDLFSWEESLPLACVQAQKLSLEYKMWPIGVYHNKAEAGSPIVVFINGIKYKKVDNSNE